MMNTNKIKLAVMMYGQSPHDLFGVIVGGVSGFFFMYSRSESMII